MVCTKMKFFGINKSKMIIGKFIPNKIYQTFVSSSEVENRSLSRTFRIKLLDTIFLHFITKNLLEVTAICISSIFWYNVPDSQ